MIEACQQEKDPKQVKRNLFALLLDVISYWVGAAFTDPMTVLLALMYRLGASATVLGLCIALRFAAQYGVQVFVAYIMHGKPKQKPFLVWAVGLSRLRDRGVWIIVGAGAAVVLLADLSGLTNGETERIWQPFFPLLLLGSCGLIVRSQRQLRGWLAVQAVPALALQLWLRSPW